MARKSTFIPTLGAATLVPMDEIPEDVKDEMLQAYETLQKADGRIRVEFDTKEEKAIFSRQAASFCAQNDPKLKFRWSPSKGLPETAGDYRVTRDVEAAGKARETTDGGSGK